MLPGEASRTQPPRHRAGFSFACSSPHQSACVTRCDIGSTVAPFTLSNPFTRTLSGWRSLPPPSSTQRAQSNPRLACPLYVSISIHLKDYSRMAVPRTSIGVGPPKGGERQSFRILQNLSFSVTLNRWFGHGHAKRGQNRNFERGFICFEG